MKPTPEQRKENRNNYEWLTRQKMETRLELLQSHLSICQILLNELFEEEVQQKAGEKYKRNSPNQNQYSRYGYNPGSVKIGDQRIQVEVPRVINNESGKFETLSTYQQVKQTPEPTDQVFNGVLKGLSTRDYEGVIDHLCEGFGLSKSSVSRSFIERSTKELEIFMSRDLSNYDIVGIFIDGLHLGGQQMMIALGVTMQGQKIPLGFTQAATENSIPIAELMNELIKRGLQYNQGILFVVDGAKGLRKGIKDAFGSKAVFQRCTWHKRTNVESYLKEEDQYWFRAEYHSALEKSTVEDAQHAINHLLIQLEKKNISAANSLREGIKEGILTLHELGINTMITRSFHTTNPIESLNSHIRKYTRKVKHWENSNMRYRWLASALLIAEQKMNKVSNYKHLPKLRNAIKEYISNSSLNQS
jgi:transposase-like protein